MTIAIIGAMEQEVTLLRAQIENLKTHTIAGFEFYTGQLAGKDIILLRSGIGKVNAAISTTILLHHFKPNSVINTGSAGGFDPDLEVGDLVISNAVTHHDVDLTPFGYAAGQVAGLPEVFTPDAHLIAQAEKALANLGGINYKLGLIASGDRFMHQPADVSATREKFPAMIACEMEAAGVAQVCHQFQVPFVIIRALSDIAGKENVLAFDEFLEVAAEQSTKVILEFLSI